MLRLLLVAALAAEWMHRWAPVVLTAGFHPGWTHRWAAVGSATVGPATVVRLAWTFRWAEQRKFKRRLARLETQHAIESERLRISQDMHDDIGSILALVAAIHLGWTRGWAAVALTARAVLAERSLLTEESPHRGARSVVVESSARVELARVASRERVEQRRSVRGAPLSVPLAVAVCRRARMDNGAPPSPAGHVRPVLGPWEQPSAHATWIRFAIRSEAHVHPHRP